MQEPVYMTCQGEKQGPFKSDFTVKHKVVGDAIPILTFANEVIAPRDAATGMATGKRNFKPVIFTKLLDSTSPMFWQAITKNEKLTKVEFTFFRIQKTGQMEPYYKITLENATLSSMKMLQATESEGGESAKTSANAGLYAAREEIGMVFEKVTWEHLVAKKMTTDAWEDRL
jgi:type VI secretion system secreted protein Hcp